MARHQSKTVRVLEELRIPYRILVHAAPAFTVAEAVVARGVHADEMVKSILLCDRDRRYVMACVLGHSRVDLKAVRACLPPEWKRLHFATEEEIQVITGSVPGAVNPIGLPAGMPVLFDVSIAACPRVNISRGDPLAGLELDPEDLIRVAHAQLVEIAETTRQNP